MESDRVLEIDPCPPGASARLIAELGISQILADILVRRGLDDPESARRFLAGDALQHAPDLLGDMVTAVPLISAAIDGGRLIAIHGDYDCDGVCATAVLVVGLRALGARVEPFVPHRTRDGYGLGVPAVDRLHAAGAGLLITVDCGITGIEAAQRARELDLPLVVTDHHRPGSELPDCPIVAPSQHGTYPFEGLCGAGVAYKVLEALVDARGADPSILDEVVDLVAIATVADLMPLVDENRGLVRRGLRRLARLRRPGLEALLRIAKVDPRAIDAEAIAFRIAPRLNAAGRLDDATRALDLLLCEDEGQAWGLAEELEQLNRRRRGIEDAMLREALTAYEALSDTARERLGVVLAGDGWHPGVVGIVAARVVGKIGKPAVLIALDGDVGRGSGRSIPAFDLHGALGACADHLERWGGHRSAAGVTVRTEHVDAFAEAFGAHADAVLRDADLRPTQRVDAVASLHEVTLEVAGELAQLDPVGMGNPQPVVWIPAAQATDLRRIGREGRHLDLRVRTAAGSCRAVAWGMGEAIDDLAAADRVDVAARITRSSWQGSDRVELVASVIQPIPAAVETEPPGCHSACDAECAERRALADAVREPRSTGERRAEVAPEIVDHRARGAMAELVRSAATCAGTLVVVRDVGRRRGLFRRGLSAPRFGLKGPYLFSCRCQDAALDSRLVAVAEGPALAMADYATLDRRPEIALSFGEVLLLDPPPEGWQPPSVEARWIRIDGAAEQAAALAAERAEDAAALAERVLRALESGPLAPDALEGALVAQATAVEADALATVLAELLAEGRVVRDGARLAVGVHAVPAEALR